MGWFIKIAWEIFLKKCSKRKQNTNFFVCFCRKRKKNNASGLDDEALSNIMAQSNSKNVPMNVIF